MELDLSGVFAPATTPFDPVTGDADLVSLRANVRAWMDAPLSGVVLFGSTGEGPLLDEDERARLTAGVRGSAGCGAPPPGRHRSRVHPRHPADDPRRRRGRAPTRCSCSRPATTARS
jgi:hypothetical protein